MAFLLDTHVLLWVATDAKELPDRTRSLVDDPDTEILFSVASIWEVVIKNGLQRPDFSVDARLLRRGSVMAGFGELAVRGHHALEVAKLPDVHRDPFDRILLAQAAAEGLRLLTVDSKVLLYGSPAEPA